MTAWKVSGALRLRMLVSGTDWEKRRRGDRVKRRKGDKVKRRRRVDRKSRIFVFMLGKFKLSY